MKSYGYRRQLQEDTRNARSEDASTGVSRQAGHAGAGCNGGANLPYVNGKRAGGLCL